MAYASITKPSLHFNTKLTTGTGNSQAVTGLGFQPDLIWGKRRDSTGQHSWFDAVRGITKGIESSTNAAEFTTTDYYSSFDSDGFTIAAGSGGAGNGNSQTAAQWCWKANGQGSSNTDGSINTTYTSANTTAGFSIIKYTGTGSNATVGHGLGVAPSFIIFKNLIASGGSAEHWVVYHKSVAPTKGIIFNLTNSADTDSAYFNNTAPTNSVFSLGSADKLNKSGQAHIAYAFAEKKGYSKFGSYTSNNTANDGPFIYTGFKPAFVITKISSGSGTNWRIFDNKRDGFNGANQHLQPNSGGAESNDSPSQMDLLSNGFKLRGAEGDSNYNTETVIYMAFAEEPLVANVGESIPTTAV